MGRSQVERNRTRGRPGRGKDGGRGKGGRSTTSTTTTTTTKKKNQANHDLGSNAFRYEKKSKGTTNDAYESFMMEDYDIGGAGGGNEFGPSHYSVARNLYQDDIIADTETDTDTSIGINTMIDVTSLSECLENSYGNSNNNVNLQYLRFDDRMREIFQKRFLDGTNETKMTIAEMRLLGSGTSSSSSRPTKNNNDDMENLEKIQEMKIEDEKIDDDSNTNDNNNDANKDDDDDSGDGEAEDLEDWLDDMIS